MTRATDSLDTTARIWDLAQFREEGEAVTLVPDDTMLR
jgi:hypothetical protein